MYVNSKYVLCSLCCYSLETPVLGAQEQNADICHNKVSLFWVFSVPRPIWFTEKYKVHTPTNVLFIKLDEVLKFTLKSLWFVPICLNLRPSSGSLHWSLAKVIFRLKFGQKLRRYMLCGGVAACHGYGVCTVRCVECVALNTANSTHTIQSHSIQRTVHTPYSHTQYREQYTHHTVTLNTPNSAHTIQSHSIQRTVQKPYSHTQHTE